MCERERESGKVVFGRELGGGERVGWCVCEGECVSLRERESGEGVCVCERKSGKVVCLGESGEGRVCVREKERVGGGLCVCVCV